VVLKNYFSKVVSQVVTLDYTTSWNEGTDIVHDIRNWDYETWYKEWLAAGNPPVTAIFSTPPCNTFSQMRYQQGRPPVTLKEWQGATRTVASIRGVDGFFARHLEDNYGAKLAYGLENPATGRITWTRLLDDIPSCQVTSWCKCGLLCNKPTGIWNNLEHFKLPELCSERSPCELRQKGIEHRSVLDMSTLDQYTLPRLIVHEFGKAASKFIKQFVAEAHQSPPDEWGREIPGFVGQKRPGGCF